MTGRPEAGTALVPLSNGRYAMGHGTQLTAFGLPAMEAAVARPEGSLRSLAPAQWESLARGRGLGFTLSLAVHALLVGALVVVPLLVTTALPEPAQAVRAF